MSRTADRDGVRVQNRTDEPRQVTIGDRGGTTTERRVDPGRVFVWSDPPDGGFDLEVATGDCRAVASIDPATSPGAITVVVTPDELEITHPGGTVTDAATRQSGATDDEWGSTSDPWDDETDSTDDGWGSSGADADWESSDTGSDEWGTPVDRDTDDPTTAATTDGADDTTVGTPDGTDDATTAGTASRRDDTTTAGTTANTDDTTGTTDTARSPDTTVSSDARSGEQRDGERRDDTAREMETRRSPAEADGTEDRTPRSESEPKSAGRQSRSGRDTDSTSGTRAAVSAADTPSPTAAREAFAETVRVDERLDELENRAVWLDQEFRVPGTNARIGVSSIVGLLPGGGDGAMFLVAMSLVYHGLRLGASTWTLTKMSVILFVEFVISIVPVLGDFVGAYWSANVQNVGYLRASRDELDGSTNWVFVLLLFSPSILTFLAVVSLL